MLPPVALCASPADVLLTRWPVALIEYLDGTPSMN
jgi:hypothetical protein